MNKSDKPRGIIRNKSNDQKFTLHREQPPDELNYLIDHFWSVQWDLPEGEKITQYVLSHPNIHISLEGNKAELHGVVTRRFERTLQNSGYVFAVKFKPASFACLTEKNIADFTDKITPLSGAIKQEFCDIFCNPIDPSQESAKISELLFFLTKIKNKPDPLVETLNSVIKKIEQDSSINGVGELEKLMGMKTRSIQRLFNKFIGVSPKWVISRYRLHEAMSLIESANDETIFSEIAYKLGYFDQAHFIKDFKRLVGQTPGEYRKQFFN